MLRTLSTALVTSALLATSSLAGEIAYGVNEAGTLFRFDTALPSAVTTIGPVGFLPEGIDFRPGTNSLYAIDVGPNTTQVYTLDVNSGAATAVGSGFPSTGVNYNLLQNSSFGFDFNPTTLQPDDSMRVRLVATNGTNLRLNSSTGQIAVVDTNLAFVTGASPFIDGAAYINNLPVSSGATALYDMDSRNDDLLLQNPPNAGTVTTVGGFGLSIDAQQGIGFDIFTPLGATDPTNADDIAYAVLRRPDAPLGGPLGSYMLYSVNLNTGTITGGALVGPSATPFDFEGGFALAPLGVPEPASLFAIALVGPFLRRCR